MFIIVDLHTYDSSILNKILLKHTCIEEKKALYSLLYRRARYLSNSPGYLSMEVEYFIKVIIQYV